MNKFCWLAFKHKPIKYLKEYISNTKFFLLLKILNDFKSLKNSANNRFRFNWQDRILCIDDKTETTEFDRHYVYHTAWAARKLAEIKPEHHVDISSYIYFSALVSAFIPIKFYDYRLAKIELSNHASEHADITSLSFEDNSIKSLSCLHVVEHIGLGRYGDPVDYDGDLKAINELKRVLAVSGYLLFAVPLGKDAHIQFNECFV